MSLLIFVLLFCIVAFVSAAPQCNAPSALDLTPCQTCTSGNNLDNIKKDGGGCVWCYGQKLEDSCRPYVLPSKFNIFNPPAPCGLEADGKTAKPFTFGGPNCDCSNGNANCGNCTKNPKCTWVHSSKVVTNYTVTTFLSKEPQHFSTEMWINETCIGGTPLGPIYDTDETKLFDLSIKDVVTIAVTSTFVPVEWYYLQCHIANQYFLYACLIAFASVIMGLCCCCNGCVRTRTRKPKPKYKERYGRLYLEEGHYPTSQKQNYRRF